MTAGDVKTNSFDQEGRLKQVEYAIESVKKSSPSIGIQYSNGILLATQRQLVSSLLKQNRLGEKIFRLSSNTYCSVSGLSSDANYLIEYARVQSENHRFMFNVNMPVRTLVERICDLKQAYTQRGGMRPFGAGIIFGGYDERDGFGLFSSDPAGNLSKWKAIAFGNNEGKINEYLGKNYKTGLSKNEAIKLAINSICENNDKEEKMDEKIEIILIEKGEDGNVISQFVGRDMIKQAIKK